MAASSSSSVLLSQLTLPSISTSHHLPQLSYHIPSSISSSNSYSHKLSYPFLPIHKTKSHVPKPFVISSSSSSSSSPALQALIFDCDGVILESENLHRQAYNDAFTHFNVRCRYTSSTQPLEWSEGFYDILQNQIGGGKPKMRWYFKENGWPSSSVFEFPPKDESERTKLIDTLQDWKTERYKEIIKSGSVEPRPGVLRLMDETKAAGIKLAVCSAATKSSVIMCLESLLGMERFLGLDCFLAGDDVKQKKPDPSIYLTAAKKLGIPAKNCLVVEDSIIGLQAASGAGMSCVITYTSSTANQDFKGASAIYPDLSSVSLEDLELLLQNILVAK